MDNRLEYIYELFPNAKCELIYSSLFQLLVVVSLSAQTTDKKVNQISPILFSKYKTIEDLANANVTDVENIIHPLGFYKIKARNIINLASIIHNKYDDQVPTDKKELVKLPGVGNKTANVFYVEGLKIPAFPVDTHIYRVAKRIKIAKKSDDILTVESKYKKLIDKNMWGQMHHSILFFGRYKCKAISPICTDCKLKDICSFKDKTHQ